MDLWSRRGPSPYLVRKEDPRRQVLDPDPGLDHLLLVGDGGVSGGRQPVVPLLLPLVAEHRQQQRSDQPRERKVEVADPVDGQPEKDLEAK